MAVAIGLVASLCLQAAPALAVRTTGWASWGSLVGGSNAYTTTMQLPAAGFPAATVTSDSRGTAQIPTGATTFLGGSADAVPTPPGIKYGSSRNMPYLNVRAKADTPTTPSITTYTFDAPTPDTGWTFVLGDIDADQVTISAKDENGATVSAAQIDSWFQGTFNYAGDADVPTWLPGTSTLIGNIGAMDTNGASAWFEPTQRLSSLTFTYTRRSGFPVYQTWFAATARTISGTVADGSLPGADCPVEQSVLTLVSPSGAVLATTSPDATGAYSFGQYATQDGYLVRITAPAGCAIVSDSQLGVSTAVGDATADFEVRAIIPQPISGVVTTANGGAPVPGTQVILTYPDGVTTVTTTTDSNGAYLFDANPLGAPYTVSVGTLPDGFDLTSPAGGSYTGITVASAPIPGLDFVLAERPSVEGVVDDGGVGIGGVTVTLTPQGGGAAVTTTTRGDGTYVFDHVPNGHYDISVEPPTGFNPAPPLTGVAVDGADVADQDFALTRPGALGGQVTDSGTGDPIAGATVIVTGPGGARTLTTDADGSYFLDQLAPGDYAVEFITPDGLAPDGPTSLDVTITDAGEIRGGLDFAAAAPAGPTGDLTPSTSAPSASTPSGSSPTDSMPPDATTPGASPSPATAATSPAGAHSGAALASTGSDALRWAAEGVVLMLVGGIALIAARRGATTRSRR